MKLKLNMMVKFFSIDSGEYDLGATIKSPILNDMSQCIGKSFTLKVNINMGIMMTENMHTLHPINIHTNSVLEILLPNDDSNDIKEFGLDVHNIQTHIFVGDGEYFCITKNINKYSHNRWIYKISNEWYLVYSRCNEIIYM